MGSKQRGINMKSKKQRLYKMKGCSRKRCVGGKKSRGKNDTRKNSMGRNAKSKGRKRRRHSSRHQLFVTYTGGDNGTMPVTTQPPPPNGSQFGSQTGGCGDSMCSLGGGGGMQGGGESALIGSSWDPSNPGGLPVPNYYALNTYSPVDISRQMIATGAQPPFSGGGVGRKRRGKKQKGGGIIDYASYITGTVTSSLGGYKGPVSPSPVVGQFASSAEHI
jgi:hypothetical protein